MTYANCYWEPGYCEGDLPTCMAHTWPSELPEPIYPGYALNPVDQCLRTDMEYGPSRNRRRTKSRNDKLDVSWQLNDAQMEIFRTWFENDLGAAGGASWFTISLALGRSGLDSVEAKFAGMWKATLSPHLSWNVSAQLEVR